MTTSYSFRQSIVVAQTADRTRFTLSAILFQRHSVLFLIRPYHKATVPKVIKALASLYPPPVESISLYFSSVQHFPCTVEKPSIS